MKMKLKHSFKNNPIPIKLSIVFKDRVALVVEPHDHVRGHIGDPKAAPRIDRETVGALERAAVEAAHEPAVRVEFEQRRVAAIENEQVASAVDRHGGNLPERHTGGELECPRLLDGSHGQRRPGNRLRRNGGTLRQRRNGRYRGDEREGRRAR